MGVGGFFAGTWALYRRNLGWLIIAGLVAGAISGVVVLVFVAIGGVVGYATFGGFSGSSGLGGRSPGRSAASSPPSPSWSPSSSSQYYRAACRRWRSTAAAAPIYSSPPPELGFEPYGARPSSPAPFDPTMGLYAAPAGAAGGYVQPPPGPPGRATEAAAWASAADPLAQRPPIADGPSAGPGALPEHPIRRGCRSEPAGALSEPICSNALRAAV